MSLLAAVDVGEQAALVDGGGEPGNVKTGGVVARRRDIGHGNDLFTRMITPELASVDDRQEEQGKEASKLLFHLIKSDAVAPAGLKTGISPELIVRPSAGI